MGEQCRYCVFTLGGAEFNKRGLISIITQASTVISVNCSTIDLLTSNRQMKMHVSLVTVIFLDVEKIRT